MRKPKLSSLLSTMSGTGLVIITAVVVLVAIAMALFGPTRSEAAALTKKDAAAVLSAKSPSAEADAETKSASATPKATASASASASGSASASASPSPTATATADPSAALASAVSGLVSADGRNVSVAVEDLSTGATAGYNVSDDYVTASIVKVDILATMLYQDQQAGTFPSSDEQSLITQMIEASSNDAALDLYNDEGGASAITAANKAFGLTDTAVYASAFGDTTTTVTDQVQLLRQVFTSDSVLSASNRNYIQGLMGGVEADERWGVSAAADASGDEATDYALKNGWLPRSATNLWEINSIGEVEHDGREYLVAVLSANNETMDGGIDVIQNVAKAAVDAVG
jgi:hypothetical protein